MIRTLILAITFVSITLCLAADDPKQAELAKKPQYERLLKGDDAKKVAELKKRIADLEGTDDYPEAIKTAEELLALRKQVQGVDHHESITAKTDISRLQKLSAQPAAKRRDYRAAYRAAIQTRSLHTQGRYAQAYSAKMKYLEICREIFGEDHPSTATSYNKLAYNLNAQGKAAEAAPHFQKALEIRRKVLGEDHPDTAQSYNNLAGNLDAQGKAAEAAPLLQKALEIRRKVLGEDHPDTAASYNNVAGNLDAQGKAAEAAPLLLKALEIRRKVLGEDHPSTAAGYNNVAANLNAQGKAVEAAPLLLKALEIHRKVLGEDHPDTAISYSNLAANLAAQGKAAEAAPLYQKALKINRKVLGEDHPDTAESYSNVAGNLDAQGKAAEAAPLYQKSLEIRRKVLGEDHPDTATSYNNVAVNLDDQGKAAEAEPLYQKALEINRKVLGEDHPDTAASYNNVAVNLDALGKAAEAAPLYQKALEINRKVLGEDHPDTAASYNNVAGNLDALGKAAEAAPLYQKALEISRKVQGEDHPDTAIIYNNVAANLKAQGKAAEVAAILQQVIFSAEASRLNRAKGIERAIGAEFNPRLLLAGIECGSKPAEAWAEVEMTLARGLLDEQGTSALTPAERADQARLRDRGTDIQYQILVLVSKPKRTDNENTRLKQLIRDRQEVGQKLATMAVAESQRAVAGREQIQAALPADAALLLWVDVSSTSGDVQEHFACVVRRVGEPKWERLPGTGEQGKWSKEDGLVPGQLRTELAARNSTQFTIKAMAKKLHAQRIAPVLKHLDGVTTLYVVGVDAMAGIPVEALTDRFAVSYVPSGTYLARLSDQPRPMGTQFLAIGDAIFETEKAKITTPTSMPPGGILIMQVIPQSPADKAGLRANDVILKYGDAEIKVIENLQKASAANAKAETVTLTVWREGRSKPFTTEIATGRMGVVLDREPAPKAIANRRKTEAMLESIWSGEWSDLPGTRVEINRLKQLCGESAKVFTDGSASEQTLESLRKSGDLSKYRYLHFATHGEGNNVKAFESSLILSQDNLPKELMPKAGEPFLNGQLSAREVLDYWKLNAELVTLSACETAIGKQGGGDGLLGFAQAFLTAGARSVCLSLWKVDDTATALLMSRFYENLLGKREGLSKPMGKAVALDEAKRWLRGLSQEEALKLTAAISNGVDRGKRGAGVKVNVLPKVEKDEKPFAHPKYWAAFVLIGEPS